MTLVSIITPSFNQARYLEQTILSVLEQDYPRIEYLIVDGGSTDGSRDIIRKYAHRLAWWVSEKDTGQAEAINKGLIRARGEVVAWLNSDDYFFPDTISEVAGLFNTHPNIVMIYGDMLAIDELGRTINHLTYKQLDLEELLCFQIIGQPAVFIRRAVLDKTGLLDPSFHYLLDHQLWIRIAQYGPMLHMSRIWAAARFHPAAKNRSQAEGFGREALRILDWVATDASLYPIFTRNSRRVFASAYRVNSRYLMDGGQSWPSIKAWLHSFIIHPPTALARMNILAGSMLNLVGLRSVREAFLRRRRDHLA